MAIAKLPVIRSPTRTCDYRKLGPRVTGFFEGLWLPLGAGYADDGVGDHRIRHLLHRFNDLFDADIGIMHWAIDRP